DLYRCTTARNVSPLLVEVRRCGSPCPFCLCFSWYRPPPTSTLFPYTTLFRSSGQVNLELPSFSLNVSTFNPFDSKDRVGDQKWYQRITVGYSLQGRNTISTADSLLFKKAALNDFTNGFQHSIPISLSLNAFKYFQFNTSVNYTERWYLQSVRKRLVNEVNGFSATRDTVSGFERAYDYSMSAGLSTKIYGMYPKMGKVEAIRHVVTPSVNI